MRVVAEIEDRRRRGGEVACRVREVRTGKLAGSRTRVVSGRAEGQLGRLANCPSMAAGFGRPKTRSSTSWRSPRRATRCGRGSACAVSASIRRRAARCSTASRISSAARTSASSASSRTPSAATCRGARTGCGDCTALFNEHALELDPLLHRLPAGNVVSHRRRRRPADPGRVPDLVWRHTGPATSRATDLAKEYTEWMRERWNHPCVVIWDAQNETSTPETGKAIHAVRHWISPAGRGTTARSPDQARPTAVEAHPYAFRTGHISGSPISPACPGTTGVPAGCPNVFPTWATIRSSSTSTAGGSTATARHDPAHGRFYESLLGTERHGDQRRRVPRAAPGGRDGVLAGHGTWPGVLHFCGLAYSAARPDERSFSSISRSSPSSRISRSTWATPSPGAALMIDFWADDLPPGGRARFRSS